MKVVLAPRQAAPKFRSLPPGTRRKLREAFRRLAADPTGTQNALDVKRLDHDAEVPVYRVRVGDWRAVFTIDQEIRVFRTFHRSEGYGWLSDLDAGPFI